MNISNLLHPEIIYGTRGPEKLRAFWKWSLAATTVLEGQRFQFDPNVLPEHASNTLMPYFKATWASEYVRQCGILKTFINLSAKTYYIPKDFFTALSKVDREIRIDYYPNNFYGYFAFPNNFVEDLEGSFYNGVYVRCTSVPDEKTERRLDLHFVTMREGADHSKFLFVKLILKDQTTISSIIDNHPKTYMRSVGMEQKTVSSDNNMGICTTIANALLYIQNESAEVKTLKPATNPNKKNGKAISTSMGKAVNNCSIPVELLSFNFHKRTNFNIDSTEVRGHFRWQPHGPGLSKIKLIWIDPHTRQFSTEE